MSSTSEEALRAQEAAAHVSNFADLAYEPLPYKPISADSHVTEPPNCYTDYIESKYRDTAPHVVKGKEGGAVYVIHGIDTTVPIGSMSAAGLNPRTMGRSMAAGTYDTIHRGGFDGVERVIAQDQDGIGGEIVYPTIGMLICNHPDADYKKACMDAYNRWMLEFMGAAPDRIFGLGQAAIRSVEEGIAEFESLKARGFRGVMMPGEPCTEFDYDDEQFDPLWQAAVSLKMPLSFHILTSKSDTRSFSGAVTHRGKAKANYQHGIIRGVQDIITMFIWGRVFERFPGLKVVCVEADAGWAPHFMYRMDHWYSRHRYWATQNDMAKLPSEFFRENVYLTFQDDYIALKTTDLMNPRRLLWANDYPHVDSTWPWSQGLIAKHTAHLPDEQKRWILRDNVAELYQLPRA